MLETIAAADLFQDLPEDVLRRLAARAGAQVFLPGDYLFRRGDVHPAMYLIRRGHVRIEWWHPALTEPVVPLELGPGDEIGALGVLDGEPRRETATATEQTETVALSARALAAVLCAAPSPAPELLRILSHRIHEVYEAAPSAARSGLHIGPATGRAPPRDRAGPAP